MSARRFPGWIAFPAPREAAAPVAGVAGDPDRRDFLKMLGIGALVLVAGPMGTRRVDAAADAAAATGEAWSPHVYLRVAEDGTVTIVCHRSEMGQGIRTTMPMIIADEMEADWSRCRVEQAEGDPKYGSQNTDGSTSIRDFLPQYREAGATARALLEDAAAREWGVPAGEVRAVQHEVVHEASGRREPFGALVRTARTIPMPAPERLRLKTPDERRWQGKQMPSIDARAITDGSALYGADPRLPGMKIAVIARPPVWGATPASVDDSKALEVPGVERVLQIPLTPVPGGYQPLGGVAVIANSTWAALRGRDALAIEWREGANGTHDSASYKAALQAAVRAPGVPGRTQGDAAKALAQAPERITADYYVPYLSHAQMEPLAALARFGNGRLEVWAPTQSPMDARNTLAEYLGMDVAQISVQVTLLGGGFGRKSKPDFICEAAWLARETGAPIRVQWSREDDMRHSYYHAAAAHHLEAAFDAAGKVNAWLHRSAYPSISATFTPDVAGPTPDELSNGASDIPWDIPHMSVEVCPARAHARIGWYRSVNAIHHGFAIGSVVDELAHAAKRDPGEFLLELIGAARVVDLAKHGVVEPGSSYYGVSWESQPLEAARASGVVRLAMEKSGWGRKLPVGTGRGIAVHRSFLSYVAMVVTVEVLPDGTVLVPRATVAVDAGFIANPDRVKAQMEGALIMAISNTLYSEISFANGRVVQGNFHDYQVTRMRAAPHAVDVHLVAGEGAPGGIGEPGVPPAGAALANAIFAATGVRVRELPVGKQLAGWSERGKGTPAGTRIA